MQKAIQDLVTQAIYVADYLEKQGEAWKPNTFRFAPELRGLAPKLRNAAEEVKKIASELPMPGQQNRDFLRNSHGEIAGYQCLVVENGEVCHDILPTASGFKNHLSRKHKVNVQDILDVPEPEASIWQ